VFTTECRVFYISEEHTPISFKYVSLWCLPLILAKPHSIEIQGSNQENQPLKTHRHDSVWCGVLAALCEEIHSSLKDGSMRRRCKHRTMFKFTLQFLSTEHGRDCTHSHHPHQNAWYKILMWRINDSDLVLLVLCLIWCSQCFFDSCNNLSFAPSFIYLFIYFSCR
jgi:hypothetical protein